MRKQFFGKIKKVLAILSIVCFTFSAAALAVSAAPGSGYPNKEIGANAHRIGDVPNSELNKMRGQYNNMKEQYGKWNGQKRNWDGQYNKWNGQKRNWDGRGNRGAGYNTWHSGYNNWYSGYNSWHSGYNSWYAKFMHWIRMYQMWCNEYDFGGFGQFW